MVLSFRALIISGLLVGLFIFALVNFGIRLTAENEVDNPLMENEAFNESFGALQTELEQSQTTAQEQREVQGETTPTTSSGDLLLESTPKTAETFTGMWRNIYDLTFGLLQRSLGINPVIIYVFTAILLVTITLLIWRLVKVGA